MNQNRSSDNVGLFLCANQVRNWSRTLRRYIYERLAGMTGAGLVVKSADGYCLAGR